MLKWCENNFSIEINKLCKSSSSACVVRHGDTAVLCSVSVGEWAGFGDCLPLTVDYIERMYAINKIPGGFNKREGKQRESEVLISRLIDRAVRGTISTNFRYEINISCIAMSYSKMCPIEPLCIIAASTGLRLAGVPCYQVAACVLNYSNGWKIGTNGKNSMLIAGNNYGVSCLGLSGSPISTENIAEGIHVASKNINQILDYANNIVQHFNQIPTWATKNTEQNSLNIDGRDIIDAYLKNDKNRISHRKSDFISKWNDKQLGEYKWNEACKSIIRSHMMWYSKRVDGRTLDDIRNINIDINYIKIHGSAVFSRGNTSVLCAATIYPNSNESQLIESLNGGENRKFILHYNYLGLGTGGRIGGNSTRRDIGHGELARSALEHCFTDNNKFIRVVADVLNSDGSSSMATVCGAYCALKAAGIKTNEIIGGVSIGGLSDGSSVKLFVDMTQLEDAISDFDLKIAGSKSGVTAIQMDVSMPYLPWNLLEQAITYGFGKLEVIINKISSLTEVAQVEQPKPQPQEKRENPDEKKITLNMREAPLNVIKQEGVLGQLISSTKARIYIKNNSLNIIADKEEVLKNAINEVIATAYKQKNKSTKALYGQIVTIGDDTVEISLLDGTKFSMKKNNLPNDIKVGDAIIVSKGRNWAFVSKL